MKKFHKCFQKEKRIKFLLQYETTKLSYFTNTKDKISLLSQLSVVNKFVCPGCSSSYIGKRERNLWERTEEHAYTNNNLKQQSAIYEQLLTCEHYNHVVDLFNVVNSFNLVNKFILFIYLNIMLKMRWIYLDYFFIVYYETDCVQFCFLCFY